MNAKEQFESLRRGLVVSCQAREDNPLHGPIFMAAMAQAAVLGGAVGIRADGVADISAIAATVGPNVPIMGIFKVKQPDGSLFITPTGDLARKVIEAGGLLVAIDGTTRPRPGGESLKQVVDAVHEASGLALADCGTLEDARYSIESGVDAIGTTMSGYTPDSPKQEGPDFELLTNMVALGSTPVFAEGRVWTREDARRAIAIGAHFVVVGTAITNPTAITSRFVTAMRG